MLATIIMNLGVEWRSSGAGRGDLTKRTARQLTKDRASASASRAGGVRRRWGGEATAERGRRRRTGRGRVGIGLNG